MKVFLSIYFNFIFFTLCVSVLAQDPGGAIVRSSWLSLNSEQREQVEQFSTAYKSFMGKAKTELTFVEEAIRLASIGGFEELRENSSLTPGARFYDVNRDRTLSLIVIGEHDFRQGFRIVGAHVDSPRLELKARALYEAEEFALFQTNYHGGLKNYQWTNLPLALMGRVDKKDGTTVKISLGNAPGEPVFIIPELAPHVDADLRERKNREVVQPEEMDPLVGHLPGIEGQSVQESIFEHLNTAYGIERDDFVSAELALVPALEPKDVGFDRGLMAMYGQDNRLSAYTALQAILEMETPSHTAIAFLVDNEEVGSVNNTGAQSNYLVDLLGRLMFTREGDDFREHWLRRALRATQAISSDVNPGINPIWPSAWEKTNAPRLGYGIGLKLYGRGFNANSEYIASIRKLLDEERIPWQVTTYKVGRGGGGTIGRYLSDDDMEVIDVGVPVLSIHSPYSVSSKIDVYWLYRGMKAFFGKD